MKVEAECGHIKKVIQGVHEGTGKLTELGAANVHAQLEQFKAVVEAENVGLRSELSAVQAGVAATQQYVAASAGAPTAVTASVPVYPSGKCHCPCVDALADRATAVEQRMTRQGSGPQGVPDPWAAFTAGANSHPPIRQPPSDLGGAGAPNGEGDNGGPSRTFVVNTALPDIVEDRHESVL